jgi:hypothetical protein
VGEFLAVIWYEKALPTWPVALRALVITGAAAAMLMARVALPVPRRFVALNVTFDVPAVVGVPWIKPVLLFTVNPAGNPVTL